MKQGDFTGIRGIPNQDISMWVTMGPIADRTNDTLGASDGAIVEFRRYMMEQVNAYVDDPEKFETGVFRGHGKDIVASWQGVIPKDVNWEDPVAREEKKLEAW